MGFWVLSLRPKYPKSSMKKDLFHLDRGFKALLWDLAIFMKYSKHTLQGDQEMALHPLPSLPVRQVSLFATKNINEPKPHAKESEHIATAKVQVGLKLGQRSV